MPDAGRKITPADAICRGGGIYNRTLVKLYRGGACVPKREEAGENEGEK